jgi:hypothetical protein
MTVQRGPRALATLLLLSCIPVAGRASAYVVNRTTHSSTIIRWMYSNTVYININSSGSSDITDGSDILAAKRSLDSWRSSTKKCSYIQFAVQSESTGAVPKVDSTTKKNVSDEYNVINWEEKNWRYDALAAALTTVFFVDKSGSDQDGRIVDADLELNGVGFQFSTAGKAGCFDIENTITHELGHVLGLDHPCDDGTRTPTPTDQNGQKIPSCSSPTLASWIKDTTMYNYAEAGETKKRTPEADDIAGICALYPTVNDPGVAAPVNLDDQGGCSLAPPAVQPAAPGPASPVVLLCALLLAARIRRTRG